MGLEDHTINGQLEKAGEFYPWKIYRVSGDPDLDYIAMYHGIPELIAQIWWSIRDGKDWYRAVVKDGDDALFGGITDDYRKIGSMLINYSDNKLHEMDSHGGSKFNRKHIVNKHPGHPCNVPTKEQLKAVVKK